MPDGSLVGYDQSICRYVLEDPVRAGMVTKTDEYPFSGTPDLIAR